MSRILCLAMLFALMSALLPVSAQETGTAVGAGLNTPVTWVDQRGNAVATMQVTDVENDWQGYREAYEPERGYIYVAVTFEVTNLSGAPLHINVFGFSVMDVEGRTDQRAFVAVPDDSDEQLFEEDIELADGETAELKQVFRVPANVPVAAFVWQPENGVLLLVDIREGATENSALAVGLNTPATLTDDRGNPIATIEVTGINPDWQDYAEVYAPDRGKVHVALDVSVTNVSSTEFTLEPFYFSLVDSTGMNNGRSGAMADEGKDPVFSEPVPIAPGDTYQGTMVFTIYADLQPAVLAWQPDSGLMHFIVLTTADQALPAGTPAATPQG